MKKVIYFLATLVIASMILASCKDDSPKEPLSITFEESGDIPITAGATKTLKYTILGATESTTVKAFVQNGWRAIVTPIGNTTGTITVTAPNPLVEDEIIVTVYEGETRTIQSNIKFISGTIIIAASETLALNYEAKSVTVNIDSDIEYSVKIHQEAQLWITIESIGTRSLLRNEKITFNIAENKGNTRNTIVSIKNNTGLELKAIAVEQAGKTYIDWLKDEADTFEKFISQNKIVILDEYPSDSTFASNEFYKDSASGVYYNVIEKGTTARAKIGQDIYIRFSGLQYFMTDDTTKYTNQTSPFPETITYRGPLSSQTIKLYSSVTLGWVTPLPNIGHNGRVKMIVPFNMGSEYNRQQYQPTYYEEVIYRFDFL